MLQTNSITISVNNDAVNYAKGNTQGIIEIPNRIWNSIISNITFPDRSFFNRLFINVSGVVNEQTLNVQDKTIDITTNGTRTVTPDVGYQGLGEVTINTNVPSGVNNQNKTLVITSNGSQTVSPDVGYSGIGNLDLTVDVPVPSLQLFKTVTISENKLTVIEPDSGYSGIRQVQVTTNIPEKRLKEETIEINTNSYQEFYPGEGYDGFSVITVETNVPQPSIQDNQILFVEAGKVARQVIVEPSEGFDALEKVTLNVGRPSLARDQNILNITTNGTYNLPSLENEPIVLGFADSCTVTVNVPSTKHVIDRVAVGYQTTPTGGSYEGVDVNLSEFERVSGNSFSASQQYGYIFAYNNNGIISIGFVVPNDNNGVNINANVSEVYYYELGPAKYVRLMNLYENNSFVGEVISNNVALGCQIASRFRKDMMSCTFFET